MLSFGDMGATQMPGTVTAVWPRGIPAELHGEVLELRAAWCCLIQIQPGAVGHDSGAQNLG